MKPAFALLLALLALPLLADAPQPGPESAVCIECHAGVHPGLVADWRSSRHAKTSPAQALALPAIQRRLSAENPPARETAVGCFECHGADPARHADTFEHFGYNIHTVVTPRDCARCHPQEADQFALGKKAGAHDNLSKNPLYFKLVDHINAVKVLASSRGKESGEVRLKSLPSSPATRHESCYGCHGTQVKVKGFQARETEFGPLSFPVLTNWPNQGVGRVNPDGSKGSCAACHARHAFSIEMARKPYTCSQCHLKPDVPAWDVYQESKHGNIFKADQSRWEWSAVPWKVGEDFKAPTCATCHNSLVTAPDGSVIAPRTHDFGARLWVRIFGLIYTHPQPKTGATHLIKNKDGLPLPTTFAGEMAAPYLIDQETQQKRRADFTRLCNACHGVNWAARHFDRFENTNRETDRMVKTATELVQSAWKTGLADPSNPFDESLEHDWISQWLFWANSVRYASAMTGAPDYAAFENGWWHLTATLRKMHEQVTKRKPHP